MAELPVRDFPVNDIFAVGSHSNVGFIHFSSGVMSPDLQFDQLKVY